VLVKLKTQKATSNTRQLYQKYTTPTNIVKATLIEKNSKAAL